MSLFLKKISCLYLNASHIVRPPVFQKQFFLDTALIRVVEDFIFGRAASLCSAVIVFSLSFTTGLVVEGNSIWLRDPGSKKPVGNK